MKKNKIVTKLKLVCFTLLCLGLTNCADQELGGSAELESQDFAEDFASKSAPPRPPAPQLGTVTVSYRSYGGFPGPNGPTFTNLDLTFNAQGNPIAQFSDQSCKTRMAIGKAAFQGLVNVIHNAEYKIGVGFPGADIGTRIVTLLPLRSDQEIRTYHLREDDTSKGHMVLVNNLPVQNRINWLIKILKNRCPVP